MHSAPESDAEDLYQAERHQGSVMSHWTVQEEGRSSVYSAPKAHIDLPQEVPVGPGMRHLGRGADKNVCIQPWMHDRATSEAAEFNGIWHTFMQHHCSRACSFIRHMVGSKAAHALQRLTTSAPRPQ